MFGAGACMVRETSGLMVSQVSQTVRQSDRGQSDSQTEDRSCSSLGGVVSTIIYLRMSGKGRSAVFAMF